MGVGDIFVVTDLVHSLFTRSEAITRYSNGDEHMARFCLQVPIGLHHMVEYALHNAVVYKTPT